MKQIVLLLLIYIAFVLQIGTVHSSQFFNVPTTLSFAPILILLVRRYLSDIETIIATAGIAILTGLIAEAGLGCPFIAAGIVLFIISLFPTEHLKQGRISWLLILSLCTFAWQLPFSIQSNLTNNKLQSLNFYSILNDVLIPTGITIAITTMLFIILLGLKTLVTTQRPSTH